MFDWVPNAPLLGGCCKCGIKVDYECMEFVVAGWYSRKYQRLDETKEILWWLRELSYDDLTGSNWV